MSRDCHVTEYPDRRLRFSSDADIVRLTNARIIIIIIGWVESFLSSCTQRVVVDGFTSHEPPVLSGVPQGTVLGPSLFLVFINNIVTDISSPIRLCRWLSLVPRGQVSDCRLLQRDLDRLVQWSKTWGMEFNVKKSNIISITNAISNKIRYQHSMDGEPVCPTDTCVYLVWLWTANSHGKNIQIESVELQIAC